MFAGTGNCAEPAPVKAFSKLRLRGVACGSLFSVATTHSGARGRLYLTRLRVTAGVTLLNSRTRLAFTRPLVCLVITFLARCDNRCWHVVITVAGTVGSGEVYSWGSNREGALGTGDTRDRFIPVVVEVRGGDRRRIECGLVCSRGHCVS